MNTPRTRIALAGLPAVLTMMVVSATQLPTLGARGLLHPARRPVETRPPDSCREETFAGHEITLQGWNCRAQGRRRATLVYLHGVADNRTGSVGVIQRFVRRGFDVVAYDSRAHGGSGGEACTYGYFEKQDLRRVIETLESNPVVLLGISLGAAVALQHAADDRRVSAVVAAETFSDLRTVVAERAPTFFTAGLFDRALTLAEQRGRFRVDAVSPVAAARRITAPVLLIHGAADTDTLPSHSRRVFAALGGPKRLFIVPAAAHNGSLRPEVWAEIEQWLDDVLDGELRADDGAFAPEKR